MNKRAKFLILDDKDNTVGIVDTELDKIFVINGLSLGSYKLIQYEAPEGLYPCRKPYYFTLEHTCCTRILKVPAGICYEHCECKEWGVDNANIAIKIDYDCKKN